MKILMAVVLSMSLLTGCNALGMLSSVLPSKPSVQASLEVDVSKGKTEEVNTQVGGTAIETETATISNIDNGLGSGDLVIILGVVVMLIAAFGYGTFRVGLLTPRPRKYWAQTDTE